MCREEEAEVTGEIKEMIFFMLLLFWIENNCFKNQREENEKEKCYHVDTITEL